ncbi:MAG: heme-copper oxidase subunit III [Candidatus Rokubacteria bacterium]|nr:heme-copper oxidase subunit III [Candidatus Rokubacteria bacterium]
MTPAVLEAPPERRPALRQPAGPGLPPPPTGGGDESGRGPAGPRPLFDNVKLGMLFFISGEIMFFGGLVSAFLVLRVAAPVWPPPLQPRLPLGVTSVNTLVLLASSVAMVAALRALARGDRPGLVRRLVVTAGLGALFLLVQGYEWTRLVHFGLTLSSGVYGATFYTLIGAHAAHVLGALVWLAVTVALAARGRFADGRTGPLRACAIYWHFVVALWPILYVAVYLA